MDALEQVVNAFRRIKKGVSGSVIDEINFLNDISDEDLEKVLEGHKQQKQFVYKLAKEYSHDVSSLNAIKRYNEIVTEAATLKVLYETKTTQKTSTQQKDGE